MPKTYRIGDLARQLSVSVETLRYYEREGLLPAAARSGGNYRLYSEAERERLEFLLHCRALDMSHEEIRRLLALRDHPESGCAEVNAVLDAHLGHVGERIRSLQRLQAQLKALRGRCAVPRQAGDCGILQGLATPPEPGPRRTSAGVHGRRRAH
jgi:Cd(II)/Pb(II)-responsive transcriptional regulator